MVLPGTVSGSMGRFASVYKMITMKEPDIDVMGVYMNSPISVAAGAALLVLLFACCMSGPDEKGMITVTPPSCKGAFPLNPYKGWVIWGKDPEYSELEANQPASLIYARLYWAKVESEKGVFDWEAFEEEWHFNEATGKRKMIIRLVLDYPRPIGEGDDEPQLPEWLLRDMGREGTVYYDERIGEGFSPDYSNRTLIAEHKRFVLTLGERYNDDPRVAFIQAGSVGHWGEWHTWPSGTGEFPSYYVAEQYVLPYVMAFPSKAVMVRRPLVIHERVPEMGVYNDIIGEANNDWGTPQWLRWINQGYTSYYDGETHPPLRSGWWQKAPSGGEFAFHPKGLLHWFTDGVFQTTMKQLSDSHTSWIGPNSPVKIEKASEYQARLDEMIKLLGYRYEIEKASWRYSVSAGSTLTVEMDIVNSGAAPIYYRWPVELALVGRNDTIWVRAVCNETDIRTWLPGGRSEVLSLNIPEGIKAGSYTLAVAIVDPATGKPGIDFAVDQGLRREDGRYILGPVVVTRE